MKNKHKTTAVYVPISLYLMTTKYLTNKRLVSNHEETRRVLLPHRGDAHYHLPT